MLPPVGMVVVSVGSCGTARVCFGALRLGVRVRAS